MQTLPQEEQSERKRIGVFFWLGRVILGLMLLTMLLVAVVHLPPIQRWGIGKATEFLSNRLGSKVDIRSFTLHPVSDVTFRDIYISSPDRPLDTLLYAGKLTVDYRRIWDILKGRANISSLVLDDGKLHLRKWAGDSLSNLDIVLSRLITPSKDTTRAGFILDLNRLAARNLQVLVDDDNLGNRLLLYFKRADFEIDQLDFPSKTISIRDADLDEPVFSVVQMLPAIDSLLPPKAQEVSGEVWTFHAGSLRLTDGTFQIANLAVPQTFYPDPFGIDYTHLNISDVDLNIESLFIHGWFFQGNDIDIHLRHQNGFEIEKLRASKAIVSDTAIHIDDFLLTSEATRISNSLSLRYNGYTDFQQFPDAVQILIPDADIDLNIRDLLALAPGLQKVEFFSQNAQQQMVLRGRVLGTINQLSVRNMQAGLGALSLTGDFSGRDLTVQDKQYLNLDLKGSAFSARAIQQIFPKWDLPPFAERLGQVNFTGKFIGYPNDFDAAGTFQTSLGAVSLDINLNTVQGMANGKYSGSIGLSEFNLGKMLGVDKLGKVSFNGIVNQGKGLTGDTFSADIAGRVQSVWFNGYNYQDLRVDGKIDNNVFDGLLDINDPNVGVHFSGIADFRDGLPRLNCNLTIDSILLGESGLMSQPVTVRGVFDIDMTVGPVQHISGTLLGTDLNLLMGDGSYCFDRLNILADVDSSGLMRSYQFDSEVFTGLLEGVFDPIKLPGQLHDYLYRYYPDVFSPPKAATAGIPTDEQQLHWDVTIHQSDNWFSLLGLPTLWLKNMHTRGSVNLTEERSTGKIELPELHYGNINAYLTSIQFAENRGRTGFDVELIAADVNEGMFFEEVLISGEATNDSVRVNVKTDNLAGFIDQIDIDFYADPHEGTWSIEANPKRLRMLGEYWAVPVGNKIEISKNAFNLENFSLVAGDQEIILDDINNKGLEAHISGFDISYLNDLWINDKFAFSGLYTLDFTIDNLYEIRQMRTDLVVPAMRINNIPYGEWKLHAFMNEPKDSVRIQLNMENREASLAVEGAYLPPIKSVPKDDQNYLRLAARTVDFPLDFLEFLMGGNIRDTEGSVDMDITLKGKLNQLVPEGSGRVYNGSTRIDYLGALYSFHDQGFKITDKMIDLSGVTLYDVQGNTASVQGGITHRYFRDLGLNATITSARIMGLDVNREQNNIFYGKGIGAVNARFTGSLANVNMQIQVTTGKGTHIYIPLSGAAEQSDKDFVVFLENGRMPVTSTTQIDLQGINLELNMTITEDATVEIIFDETTNEIMRGTGRGNLQLSMTRTGQFSMYGNYVISEGDYLFTNFSIVRKPFVIKEGSTIHWDGDPYDATLNVQAQYKGLTAPVFPLIEEFIGADATLRSQAKERTPVDLTMTLRGSLLHPTFTFDIAFPELTGTLKAYTDSKINTLKANEHAMLVQVMGLVGARSFLPSTSVGVGTLSRSIDNTLSELISATLSSYLGGLLSDVIPQGTFFTGIDLNIGLDLPFTSGQGTGVIDEEGNIEDPTAASAEISLPLEFFNDRLSVNVGGNYVRGATLVEAGEYWAGDVTFEYHITPDRRLRIRAYNRNTVTVEGRRNKIGVGLSFRREYDSLSEIFGRRNRKKQ